MLRLGINNVAMCYLLTPSFVCMQQVSYTLDIIAPEVILRIISVLFNVTSKEV